VALCLAGGTQGVTYGPAVLWFYGVVHALFGEAPGTSILVMCFTVTLAHLALVVALTRLFRGDVLLLAALVRGGLSLPVLLVAPGVGPCFLRSARASSAAFS
jgi:hypothetical protein